MPLNYFDHFGVAQWRSLFRRGRWWLLTLAVLFIMVGMAWWAVLFEILPRMGQWREELAQQATKALGVPVRIGSVSGRAEGLSPVLTLREVVFLDDRGSVALRLPEVAARISPSSLWPTALWRQEVRMDRLVLIKPDLQIRRDAQGDLHVAGLRLSAQQASPSDGKALDWLLSQPLIRIDRGSLRWTDEMSGAPTLSLKQVDIALSRRRGLGNTLHELKIQATPSEQFGQRFDISARMTQPLWSLTAKEAEAGEQALPWWRQWFGSAPRPSDFSSWSGRLAVNFPHADVQSLRAHVSLPVDVQGGSGRISAELMFKRGAPNALKVDVDVQHVNVRMDPTLQPLAFERLSGSFSAQHDLTHSQLDLGKVSFTTADGLVWPASSATLQWRHTPLGGRFNSDLWRQTLGGQFESDRLDLALLARLADRLPLPASMRQSLDDLAPQGVGQNLSWIWEGPADDPRRYKARGRFQGMGWAASPRSGRPGLAHADLDLNADERGGRSSLSIVQGWLELPGAFDEPRLPFRDLTAKVSWKVTPGQNPGAQSQVMVDVKQAAFSNDDAQGQLEARWQTGGQGVARFPGSLDLEGRLAWGQANRVWRYLPSSIPFSARDYVRLALKEGRGENVTFEVKGDLAQFPFKDDQGGRFRVNVPAKNITLDYVPASIASPTPALTLWPAFTGLDGQLVFEGLRLRIEGAQAQLGGLGTGRFTLRDVHGRIENLASDDPHLSISGQGQGPLNDLLRYMAVSPVGVWTGNLLHKAEGSGTGALQLALDIPLNHTDKTGLKGRVILKESDQASLRLHPSVPLLKAVRGQVDFTQQTLKVSALSNVWGQEVAIEGQQDASGNPKFVAKGLIDAEGLRTASEWPALAQLAQRMSGQTPVTVTVAVPVGHDSAQPELHVTSDLKGLAFDLPSPLNKRADAAWPLTLVHRGEDAKALTDALSLELGGPLSGAVAGTPWVRADYRRDVSTDAPKVTRGVLSLVQASAGTAMAAPALPPKGVVAQVTVPSLDMDAWQGLARVVRAPSSNAASGEDYLPDTITVKAGVLTYQQRNLKEVSATLAHPAVGVWRAQIDAAQLAGQIEIRTDTTPLVNASGGSRVVARLSRLSVPAAEAQAFEDQAAAQLMTTDPTSVPALDIVIDELDWRGISMGKLEVEAINRLAPLLTGGGQPEWRLNKLRISAPEAQLNATGNWAASASSPGKPKQRAAFNFVLDINNSGALLARLGLPQTIKGGKGKLTGQVAWLGSPLEPNAASMTGQLAVDIKEGQFLKVDPGMAKLLGVLSLQSLPRRFTLDFRDLFQQGFAFDAIDGDVSIQQGVADTRNLRMRGVQAVVMMEGQADLIKETQNLHVFVVPEVNAGAASLAYAVINPAVGLGTFIAQVLLRKQVSEASSREFNITGSWVDPQVERVIRAPVAASAPASSASAAAKAAVKTPS